MVSNRDAITSVTNLFFRLASAHENLRRGAIEEWLQSTDNPLSRALGHFASSREPLAEQDHTALANAWKTFDKRRDSVGTHLKTCCPSHWRLSAGNGDFVDLNRLVSHLRAYVATAVAAYWAGQATSTQAADQELRHWLTLAAGLSEHPTTQPTGWTSGMAAAKRVALAAQGLVASVPPAELLRAYGWTCFWLDALQPECSRTVPIVTVETEWGQPADKHEADLHHIDLDLLRFPETLAGITAGAVVEHPAQWNQPLGVTFAATVGEAHRDTWRDCARAAPLLWRLHVNRRLTGEPLYGPSHGLAVHVGCRLLRDNMIHDHDIVFSARVENGEVKSVEGLNAKRDRVGHDRYRRFGFAGSGHPFSQQEIERSQRSNPPELIPIGTIEDAVNQATQTHQAVVKYLQAVCALPDRGGRAYWLPRDASALYVPPDVLEQAMGDEIEARRKRQEKKERESSARGQGLLPQDLDSGEKLPFDDEEPERRRGWNEVRTELQAAARARGLLVGPPGQGKTFLAHMTARQQAEDALAAVEKQTAGLDSVDLPLVVSLPMVLKQRREAGRSDEEHAQEALLKGLRQQIGTLPDRAAEYLRRHLAGQRIWWFVDGLDEAPKEAPELRAVLHFMGQVGGKVFLGTRPYGLEEHQQALREAWLGLTGNAPYPDHVKTYRLAPFTPGWQGQVERFVGHWFGELGQAPVGFRELLDRSPSVQTLARNPFLLALLCAVASKAAREETPLSADITRGELYDRFLTILFSVHDQPRRFREWEFFLPRMALRMIARDEFAIRQPAIHGEDELEGWLRDKTFETVPYPLDANARGDPSREPQNLREELLDQVPDGRKMRLLVSGEPTRVSFATSLLTAPSPSTWPRVVWRIMTIGERPFHRGLARGSAAAVRARSSTSSPGGPTGTRSSSSRPVSSTIRPCYWICSLPPVPTTSSATDWLSPPSVCRRFQNRAVSLGRCRNLLITSPGCCSRSGGGTPNVTRSK